MRQKSLPVFFENYVQTFAFLANFASESESQKCDGKNEINVRVFYTQGNSKIVRGFYSKEKFRKSEYFCEHRKFIGGFLARAFQNLGD